MELPLEEVWGVTAATARHEESEIGSGEPRYADVELEQDQEGSVPTPVELEQDQEGSVPRNEESEIDNDEQDKERSVPLSTSRNGGSDTDSVKQEKGRRTPTPTSRNEESDPDSGGESTDDDLEIEQRRIVCSENSSGDPSIEVLDDKTPAEEQEGARDGNAHMQVEQSSIVCSEDSSGDSSTEFLDDQPIAEKEEVARDGNAHMQEEQSIPKASTEEQYESFSSVDGVIEASMEIGPEIAESNKQVLGDDVGTALPASEEVSERDKNAGLQSLNAPTDKESKPSSSQVNIARDMGPELVEFDAKGLDDPTETENEYVKKGFTCDGNTEEEEDEHLREYWTRALQTSTSTGQVVEEIVKVLKHHQKTHDLLCPVCGSCVTRRVILRKRKRSSLISVDRWYRDPLDEGEIQEQGSSLEVMEAREEEDAQEYQDTKAFGCLACFSLFVEKGYLLLNQLQANIGSDTFNCLPFFFPPYPWGMTQRKPRSPDVLEEELIFQEAEEAAVLDVQESLTVDVQESVIADVRSNFTCGIGSTLLPDYPWGTMPCLSKGVLEEEPSLQEPEGAAVLDVQESLPSDVKSDFTCGIGSTLLPDFPWGTMPSLSRGDVVDPSNQTETDILVVSGSGQDVEQAQDVSQIEDIEESSQPSIKERACTCGLAPTLLPAYPWGYCAESEGEQMQGPEDAGASPHHVEGRQPSTNESTCTCGLAPALIPDYPWGYLSKVEGEQIQGPENAGASSHPVEGPQPSTNESTRTCGLAPALIPAYPWGYLSKVEAVALQSPSDLEAGLEDSSSTVVEDTNLQSVSQPEISEEPPQLCREGKNCSCVPALLPDYPWGFFVKDEDSCNVETRIEPQAKAVEETKGKMAEDIGPSCDLVSTVLPDYPWGITTESGGVLEEVPILGEESKSRRKRINFLQNGTHLHVGAAVLPSYPWGVCSVNHGDLTTPLLNASQLSNEGGLTAPLLSASGYIEEIEEVKGPLVRPQIPSVTETVLDVVPGDLGGTSVGTIAPIAVAVPSKMRKEEYEWDILKSIVYGGLDISIASLGVTSSAAGGNAITRTVVYMGISTLVSGLIGFYHHVLNLYHHHRDHYTEAVGLTLMLHGTVALISYVVFGLLSPLIYAFSYRKTDSRDNKFMLCCGVTIVAVTALALGKARVTNKRYLRTLLAYFSGGVLAAIVGYLTGEHVAELLEEWGI